MRICAAQFRSIAGDIAKNIESHRSLIDLAVSQRANLIFFPELSLTGYEPALAKELATQPDDARWDVFQELSDAHGIIIGVGLPFLPDTSAATERDANQQAPGTQIGMIFFQPTQPRVWYAKQRLHSDELPFFVRGDKQLLLQTHGHTLTPAICYESLQPDHAAHAARCGADIYLASVAKPDRGIVKAFAHYPVIAKQHSLTVLMANSIGPSDNFVSAGQSAAWNNRGELVSQLNDDEEGLLLFDTDPFLEATDFIDWQHPDVLARARSLAAGCSGTVDIAKRCFEWVRDEIKHSLDHGLQPVTCSASEVLQDGSGFCYAKSHLLAALLRANGIPAALCYQRLSCNDSGTQFCLHGLNAIHLPDIGWYRVDARGNRADVNAQFTPPIEQLAFKPSLVGESDLPLRFEEPLPEVIAALTSHTTVNELRDRLPDLRS